MTTKKQNPFYENRFEICYKLINASLAGLIAISKDLLNQQITPSTLGYGFFWFIAVAMIQFKAYWDGEESEYKSCPGKKGSVSLANFLNI